MTIFPTINPSPIFNLLALNCRIGYIQDDHLILTGLWNTHHQHARLLPTTRTESCSTILHQHTFREMAWPEAFRIRLNLHHPCKRSQHSSRSHWGVFNLHEHVECLKLHMDLQPMHGFAYPMSSVLFYDTRCKPQLLMEQAWMKSLFSLRLMPSFGGHWALHYPRFLTFVAFGFLDRVLWPCLIIYEGK